MTLFQNAAQSTCILCKVSCYVYLVKSVVFGIAALNSRTDHHDQIATLYIFVKSTVIASYVSTEDPKISKSYTHCRVGDPLVRS